MKNKVLISVSLFFLVFSTFANNFRITGGQRLPAPNRDKFTFTISWDNSWQVAGDPGNHDAIWTIIKFRPCDAGAWEHGLLDSTDYAFNSLITIAQDISITDRLGRVPAGATPTNGKGNNTGIMIKRADYNIGHIVNAVCTLTIVNPSFADDVEYDIRVVGIEMVQARAGSFAVGDGASTNALTFTSITNEENAYTADHFGATPGHDSITSDYPKGVGGFYCMKYEISSALFATFMNTSDGYLGSPGTYHGINRNTLSTVRDGSGGYPDRAQNFIAWADIIAFCDWAALRPMTELEYEKACRGSAVTAGEYAWGNLDINYIWFLDRVEDGTEWVHTYEANCHYQNNNGGKSNDWQTPAYTIPGSIQVRSAPASYGFGTLSDDGSCDTRYTATPADATIDLPYIGGSSSNGYWRFIPITEYPSMDVLGFGPVGVGIFARDSTQTRVTTGASYWGAMEMSGNVAELCVSIHCTDYEGSWGDGYCDIFPTDWPSDDADSLMFFPRGGSYGTPKERCRVSDRYFYDFDVNSTRFTDREGQNFYYDTSPDNHYNDRGDCGGRGLR